jgi:hypothetical protein
VSGALAASGLCELFLQRIVYRVGVHIPRQGAFLEAYRFATTSGDFAFKTTAVLLALAVPLAFLWLLQRRSYIAAGMLAALAAVNLAAWPLGLHDAVVAAPLVFAFGVVWVAGQGVRSQSRLLSLMILAAAAALALSQYRAGMAALGDEPSRVDLLQLASEVALIGAAVCAGLAAGRARFSRRAALAGGALTALLLVAYMREPATVAIVSLWATGVTMSLPGLLYIAGFGLVVFAALTWLRRPETRHLAIALALLLVAGLQPQALHHGLTAFLGVLLLTAKAGELAPASSPALEVDNASRR